jgi:hypothetical protein
MPTFTNRELTIDQIAGAAVLAVGLVMGIIGAICLKHGVGLPEYIKGLKGTGWTLALLGGIWTSLATWRRLSN